MRMHACVWHFFFSTGSNSSRLEAARVKKKIQASHEGCD